MAQFYSLDEAARVLGIAPEALKAKAQSREVRAFLDGGSWRFRVVDIDELARRQGLGSDAELHLSDFWKRPSNPQPEPGTDILDLSDFQIGIGPTDLASKSDELPSEKKPAGAGDQTGGSDSNYHVFLDDLAVPPGPAVASSSVMIGMSNAIADVDDTGAIGPKRGTGQDMDQDPLLAALAPDRSGIADRPFLPIDSDVLLVSPDPFTPSTADSDVHLAGDVSSSSDSWEFDAEQLRTGGSSSSAELQTLELESSAELKLPDDRNFESSGPFLVAGMGPQADDRNFESSGPFLVAGMGSRDDVPVPPAGLPSDSDVTIAEHLFPGDVLSQFSDSGLSLEPQSEFSLELDSGSGLAPLSSGDVTSPPLTSQPLASPEEPHTAPAQTPAPAATRIDDGFNADSDFDLSLSAIVREEDDPTALAEQESDFELDEVDSGSEVFAVGEEVGVDQNAATVTAPVDFDEDDDDETELPVVTAATQQRGTRDTLSTIAGELLTSQPGREHRRVSVPSLMTASSDLEYTPLTIGLLSMALLVMLFAAFVVNDLAHYEGFPQDGWTGAGLIRQLAGIFGG